MALINLQTNLKSLKYKDFNVEPPFITKDINNPPNESGLQKAATHRVDDLERFGKFLTSGQGVAWIAKQGALNVLEAKIKTPATGNARSFAGQLLSGGWSTAKLIASTTAQIPVNGTGTHFVEGFGGKSGYLKGVQGHVLSKAGKIINTQGILENVESAEVGKRGSKILGQYLRPGSIQTFDIKTNKFIDDPDKPKDRTFLQNIFGGGNPTPDKLEYRTNKIIQEPGFSYGGHSVIQQTANNQTITEEDAQGGVKTTEIIRERNKQGFKNNQDVITLRKPVTGSLNSFVATMQEEANFEVDQYDANDLIKFNIKTISPRSSNQDGPLVTRLDFRAYLDSFSDSFNGDWDATRYIGRAEELYSYSGFSRSIQFGFKVVAHSQAELIPLYDKLNKLAGSTAPNYNNQSYMRGTFNMLTIGDYLINMPGFISSLTLTWNTDYPWQTKANEGGDELPTILDVGVTYQPIHRKAPTNGMLFIGDYNESLKDTDISPDAIMLDEVVITS